MRKVSSFIVVFVCGKGHVYSTVAACLYQFVPGF